MAARRKEGYRILIRGIKSRLVKGILGNKEVVDFFPSVLWLGMRLYFHLLESMRKEWNFDVLL